MKVRKRFKQRLGGILLLLLLGGMFASYRAATFIITPRNRGPQALPADFPAESVSFRDRTGAEVQGWLAIGKPGAGVVMLAHGITANRLSMMPRARFLLREGFSVLLIDLWAHGQSDGDVMTFGYHESESVSAALRFLEERLPNERRGVIGQSLGGAALLLEKDRRPIHGAVLETVYSNIYDATKNRVKLQGGSIAAPVLAWLLLAQLPARVGIWPSDLQPIDHIGELGAPLLLAYGEVDQHTTLDESKRMFEAAREPKEEWMVPKMPHFDIYQFAPAEYEQRIGEFFTRTLRAGAGSNAAP